jgi:monothiol glutaredoxin
MGLKMISQTNLAHLLATNPSILFVSGSSRATRHSNNQFAVEIVEEFDEGTLVVDVLKDSLLFKQLLDISPWRILPQLFVNAEFVGGSIVIEEFFRSGEHRRRLGLPEKKNEDRTNRRPLQSYWRIAEADGFFIAACADGHAHFLGNETFNIAHRIELTKGWVNCVASDSRRAYFGDTSGILHSICLDAISHSEQICTVGSWINDIATLEDQEKLAFIDGNGCVYLHDSADRSTRKIISSDRIGWSISYNKCAGVLASGLNDGTLLVTDLEGIEIYAARLLSGPISCLNQWREFLLFGGYGPNLGVLNLKTFELEQYQLHRERIWDIRVVDGKAITSSGDVSIAVFDLEDRAMLSRKELSKMPIMLSPSLHAGRLAIFFADGTSGCEVLNERFSFY